MKNLIQIESLKPATVSPPAQDKIKVRAAADARVVDLARTMYVR